LAWRAPGSPERRRAFRNVAASEKSEALAGIDVHHPTTFLAILRDMVRCQMTDGWKNRARPIKHDVHALYLASRDPRVPWYAKAMALVVAGYALSPIDLIPDFIPVLGYLDDLILVPLGILLVIRLIPPGIMAEHRDLAAAARERPVTRVTVLVIVTIWIACAALCVLLAHHYFRSW
jgi:uncharacterized membrane protein YkvA (DUF1232 family)